MFFSWIRGPTDRRRSAPREVLQFVFTVFLASTWLFEGCGGQSSSSPQLLLQGRFQPGNSSGGFATLPQTFSWPASSAFVSIQGANSVTVALKAIPQSNTLTFAINWFRFFVDGTAVLDGLTSYNQLELKATINVTSGTHILGITKMDEGGKGEAILESITLNAGSFLPLNGSTNFNILSPKRILVIGDSYTTGYANAGAVDRSTCTPSASELKPEWITTCSSVQITDSSECAAFWTSLNQNNLAAYGPVTANALGADYQIVAESGSGMIGYSYAAVLNPGKPLSYLQQNEPSNELFYNRSVYSDPNAIFPLNSWLPQIVVIASGTNDWKGTTMDYSVDQWTARAADFLQTVSTSLQNPRMILLIFPTEISTSQYTQAMASLAAEAQRRKLPVTTLQLKMGPGLDPSTWCDQHPSAVAHATIAEALVAVIAQLQPSWKTVQSIDRNPSQSFLRFHTSLYTGGSFNSTVSGGSATSPPVAPSPISASFSMAGSPSSSPPMTSYFGYPAVNG